MRKTLWFPLGLCLLLLSTAAVADSISTITPSSILQYSTETFVTIDGTGLLGTSLVDPATEVVFSNSAGTFTIAASSATDTEVIVAVPDPVLSVTDPVSVTVLAHDTSSTRMIGPAFLTVTPIATMQPPLLNTPESVSAEAASTSGANVTFTVTGFSFVDPSSLTVTCDHNSGDLYPLGTTLVTCTATDSFASTVASFPVLVTDTLGPVITVPADIVTNNPVVTFTVTAVDAISGSITPICSPASGSTFPNGTTFVVCTAEDTHANTATATFRVSVNVTPPSLNLPANITVGGHGVPASAVVNYTVTTDADATVDCTPPSGSSFLGTTVVNCTATNVGGGITTGHFTVTVVGDTTPPVLTLPADITAEATSASGAIVTFTATAIDDSDGPVPVVCVPASGSVFALGLTTVHCSATDAASNVATGTFKVTVRDTTPPVLSLPAPITAEATGPAGAAVSYSAAATDAVDGSVPITCTPAPGSTFAIGTSTVSCTATDSHSNVAHGSFTITVRDTTPPVLHLPADITRLILIGDGDHVTYTATATDLVDGNVSVTCTPPSGFEFPIGTTTVHCSSTDSHSNTATGTFHVTVHGTFPPFVLAVVANPSILWPADHRMVNVTVGVVAIDLTDPNPTSSIVSVSSNQPISGTGPGDLSPDWIITGPLTLQLRAERAGNQTRVYTINIQTVDSSGLTTMSATQVYVAPLIGHH